MKQMTCAGLIALSALLVGCPKSENNADLGKGGSVVTGSGGAAGNKNAAKELVQCTEPIAVVSLVENTAGYVGIGRGGLPESPLPLVRVMMQQSNCFRIVDRNSGLRSTVQEQELKDKGVVRSDGAGQVAKGRGLAAQFSVVPSLTFSEQDAGKNIGGVLSAMGMDKVAGAAAGVKLKEAQVVLLMTDNETTEQLAAATGAARTTDLGIGGLAIGKTGGAGALGWSNTNEGKVIAAAFLDAHNNLVAQARAMNAKAMPEANPATSPKK